MIKFPAILMASYFFHVFNLYLHTLLVLSPVLWEELLKQLQMHILNCLKICN